jgi:hypothetical protein
MAWLRLGGHEAVEARLAPRDESLGRALAHDPLDLLGIVAGLREQPRVLGLVLRGLHDHGPGGIEARPPGATGDLVELASTQLAHLRAVELGERREQHRANRHVDADSEGVRAANHLEEALLRELLDEPAVLGQHSGVVHADARTDETGQRAAEVGREAEVADRHCDLVALLPRGDLHARERLRAFEGRELGEVHDVDGGLVGLQQVFDRLVHRRRGVGVVQRHRAVDPDNDRRVSSVAFAQILREPVDVAEGGRHEDELHPRQGEERHLPGPAPIGVGVEVEFVHHDLVDRGVRPVAQGKVGEDLRRATDDGSVGVHARVARHHPHSLRAEDRDEREELLRHERLDGSGIERALALAERREVGADRHKRLSRAGRRAQDEVGAGDDLDERFVLGRVEAEALPERPVHERRVDGIRIVTLGDPRDEAPFNHGGRRQVRRRARHRPRSPRRRG